MAITCAVVQQCVNAGEHIDPIDLRAVGRVQIAQHQRTTGAFNQQHVPSRDARITMHGHLHTHIRASPANHRLAIE